MFGQFISSFGGWSRVNEIKSRGFEVFVETSKPLEREKRRAEGHKGEYINSLLYAFV